MPFVANAAVLGADLHQSSTIDGSPYDYWQPVLLAGNVTMSADNKPDLEKYRVLSERLDPGDVVHIGDKEETELTANGRNAVWGMLTIGIGSGTAAAPAGTAATIQVVLHTSLREVSVTRFGAPGGHVVKASWWSILQKWPNGQSIWVGFVSVLLILGFALQLGGSLASRASAAAPQALLPGVQDAELRIKEALAMPAPGPEVQPVIVEGIPTLSSHAEPEDRAPEENKNVDHQIPPPPH
jgi:hypothetical protein